MSRNALIGAVAAVLVGLSLPASAPAATVTLGSPLIGDFSQYSLGGLPNSPNTWANTAIATPGATVASPVAGVVVRWRMTGAFTGGPFRLRVIRPDGSGKYSSAGTGEWMQPTGAPATQTFASSLAIAPGDLVGIDPSATSDRIGTAVVNVAGTTTTYWQPRLVDGGGATAPTGAFNPGAELGLNADVLPAPTVAAITPTKGSFAGAKVVITGSDLAETRSVTFGSVPAASFVVDSDTQVTATSPKVKSLGKAAVSVSTPAGAATAAAQFAYTGCKVPKLKKKSLKSAKKLLKKGGCKLGKVKRTGGATNKTGRVRSQSKKAGKLLAGGTKINLKLGPK